MRTAFRSITRLATLSMMFAVAGAGRLSAQAANAADSVTAVTSDSLNAGGRAAAPSSSTRPAGAAMNGLRSAVHTRETAPDFQPKMAATRAGLGQAQAMMVVGAAALITGAIIGGDPGTIIMVGGAVIGLYGLYQYLQ